MRRTALTLAVLTAATIALTGCADGRPETAHSGSPASTATPTRTNPPVFRNSLKIQYGDPASLEADDDPALGNLADLIKSHKRVALDLTLFNDPSLHGLTGLANGIFVVHFVGKGSDGDELDLILKVPEDAVTLGDPDPRAQDPFATLRGIFTVTTSSAATPTYALTVSGTLPEATTEDKARCGAADTETDLVEAAHRLANDSGAYRDLHDDWRNAPRLWWAVKATATTLKVLKDGTVGDSMSVACASYYEPESSPGNGGTREPA